MKLITLPDYISYPITVTNAGGMSTEFSICFKILNKITKKRLKQRILKNFTDYKVIQGILRTNISRVENLALLDNTLTTSSDLGIINQLLISNPYFEIILTIFLQYLTHAKITSETILNLRQNNLYQLGEYQAKIDFNLYDKELETQKEILEKYGSIIAFPEQKKQQQEEEKVQILLESNKDIFNIFLLARKWTGEFGQLDMSVIVQLTKEHGCKLKDIIDELAIIYSAYLEHKPKET